MKLPKIKTITYAVLRATQLFSLLALGLSTIVTWIVVMYFALEASLESDRKHGGFNDTESVNEYISSLVSAVSAIVWQWLIISAVLTGLLLIFKRVREHNKTYIISSGVVIIFCFIAAALTQYLVKYLFVKIIGI